MTGTTEEPSAEDGLTPFERAVSRMLSTLAAEELAVGAVVHLADEARGELRPLTVLGRDAALLGTLPAIPLDPSYEAASVFLTGLPVAARGLGGEGADGSGGEGADGLDGVARWRDGLNVGAHAVLPLHAEDGRPFGTLTLRWDGDRALDTEALDALGRRIRESARRLPAGHAARVVAWTLPAAVPALDLAVAYPEPPAAARSVFHEAFALPGGGLAIVLGRLRRAEDDRHVGLVRNAILTSAVVGHGPAAVLGLTNEALVHLSDGDGLASVFLGVLDPKTRVLTYASTGACPPLLVRGDSGGVTVLAKPQPVVGAFSAVTYVERLQILVPGDVVLAYTLPGGPAYPGPGAVNAVAGAVGRAPRTPAEVVRAALSAMDPRPAGTPYGGSALAAQLVAAPHVGAATA